MLMNEWMKQNACLDWGACFPALRCVFMRAVAAPSTETLKRSPVSSHDPSATPIIPRARTRWKKAAAAGEQCFGFKTPTRWIRRTYRHVWNQVRSCVGEWGTKWAFIAGECFGFCWDLRDGIVWLGANGWCTETQHHCFCCMGRNAGFQTGQLAAN